MATDDNIQFPEQRMDSMEYGCYHVPVLLEESIAGLNINPNGVYVDATFGGGGHSREILKRLKNGKLVAFDQDSESSEQADLIKHRSFTFCQANFRHLNRYLKWQRIDKVDGIIADLGVSSHQIDTVERGFSIRHDAALDMRMNIETENTAMKIIAHYSEFELQRLLSRFGEIRNARTAARAVVNARNKPITTTSQLIDVLKHLAPRGSENKYFARVFQALRIEVNDELQALEDFLHQCGEKICSGGRLVVISYHSLEDRIVKNYVSTGNAEGNVEKDFYGNKIAPFFSISRKPVISTLDEIKRNKRARSAKMRIAQRT